MQQRNFLFRSYEVYNFKILKLHQKNYNKSAEKIVNYVFSMTTENYNKFNQESKENHVFKRIDEEKLLRNLIVSYLPKLTEIYHQYATIMTEEKHVKSKAILTRLFLWQLLRDIELPSQGVSLVDVDVFMAKNPRCCLESNHNPFELIYFWQFIQALLGCAWLLHVVKTHQHFVTFADGTICNIFKHFIEDVVSPNAGRFIGTWVLYVCSSIITFLLFLGTCLTTHKDIVPIKCVYQLYLKIGEPISVHDFLYFTCAKDNKQPPCYAIINDTEEKSKNVKDGSNVTVGDKIIYLQGIKYVYSV